MNYKIIFIITAPTKEDADDTASEIRGYIEDYLVSDDIDIVAHAVENE